MDDQEREPTNNFTSRLRVQTAYPDGFRDHRQGFHKEQYFFNNQNEPRNTESSGFVPLNNTVRPSKKKDTTVNKTTTDKEDTALKKAVKDDLTKRGL